MEGGNNLIDLGFGNCCTIENDQYDLSYFPFIVYAYLRRWEALEICDSEKRAYRLDDLSKEKRRWIQSEAAQGRCQWGAGGQCLSKTTDAFYTETSEHRRLISRPALLPDLLFRFLLFFFFFIFLPRYFNCLFGIRERIVSFRSELYESFGNIFG